MEKPDIMLEIISIIIIMLEINDFHVLTIIL